MKLCVSVSWCRIGWLFTVLNLLFLPIFSYSQNLPPVLDQGIPNQHAEVGSVFSYLISSKALKDDNGDPLSYSIDNNNLPSGLLFDQPSRIISGNPTTIGIYTIPVSVSDGTTSTLTQFNITVHAKDATYAAFTMDYQTSCNYKLVNFTNLSKNANTYIWTLGNGNTVYNSDPATIYNKAGIYTVTLTINGGGSPELTHSETVTIYPKPSPVIDNISNGCEPLTATLTSSGTPIKISATTINDQQVGEVTGGAESYYYWYFFEKHEGVYTTTASTEIDSFLYGKYKVNLEVTDENGCHGTTYANDLFEVYDKPEAYFTYNKTDNCEPSLTTFSDGSTIQGSTITNYAWTVNGNALSENNNTVDYDFEPLGSGNYEVTLQTTSRLGCVSEIYKDTVRFNNQNTTDFTMGIDSVFCVSDSIYLNAVTSAGAVTYAWDIDDNGSIENTNKDFNYAFISPGTHNIKLTVDFNDGCSRDTIKKVYIDQINTDFAISYTYDCSSSFIVTFSDSSSSALGDPITTYNWYLIKTGENELLSTLSNFKDTIVSEGIYEIMLELENENGCNTSVTRSIALQYPQLDIEVSGITNGCFPAAGATNFQAIFTSPNENPISYEWDFGDGNNGTGEYTSHTYISSGNFNVTLTVTTANCTYNVTKQNATTFPNQPTITNIDLIQQPEQCYGLGIKLNVDYSAGTALFFETPSGTVTQTSLTTSPYSFEYFPPDTGLFDIIVTLSNNGCLSYPDTIKNIFTNEPKAYFIPDQTSFCDAPPYDIHFDNLSTFSDPLTTFEWDFGDGETSTEVSPEHEYKNTYNYNVTLRAIHPTNGCEDIYEDSIFIFSYSETPNIITADISSGCAPLSVQFSQTIDSSLSANFNPTEFEWYFNSNDEPDTVTNMDTIVYTFDEPGVYSIRLVAKNNSRCEYTFTDSNMIDVHGPIANFSYELPTCINQPVLFNNLTTKSPADSADSTKNSYEWNFGDGSTDTIKDPTHTYTGDDIYTVSLIAIDENFCSDTLTLEGLIDIQPFDTRFLLSDTIVCDNAPITFSNASVGDIVRYTWGFDDGTPDSTATTFNDFSYTFTTPRVYHPTLETVSVDGCIQTYSRKVTVVDVNADFTISPSEIVCAPTFIDFEPLANADEVENYFWRFGNGNTSTIRSPKNYYNLPGHYTVILEIDFKGNCSKADTLEVIVDGAYGDFIYDDEPGCAPYTVQFSVENMSRVSYIQWDYGIGIIDTDTIAPGDTKRDRSFDYTSGGYARPRVLLTDSVCGDYTYYNDAMGDIYTSVPPVVDFTTNKDSVCKGVEIQFNDATVSNDPEHDLASWNWEFGDINNSSSSERNPVFTYRETGTYSPSLRVENELGCSTTLTKTNSIDIFSNTDLRADFVIDDQLACPNQLLEFTSNGKAGDLHSVEKYEWDFGDGFSEGNNTENYSYDDSFRGNSVTVWHKVTDDQFCTDSTSLTVDINNLQAGFDYDPQLVYRSSPVDFNDTSKTDFNTKITDWNWTFQDASQVSSTNPSPQNVSFLNIQQDIVTLTIKNDNDCEATTIAYIDVLNNPPTLDSLSILMIENQSYTFDITDFDNEDLLKDNFDPKDNNQSLYAIKIEQAPSNGQLFLINNPVVNGDSIAASNIGLLKFVPNINWNGNTSFTWNGNDGYGWANHAEKVFIRVIPEPDPPIVKNISYSVPEDSVITITKQDFLDHMSSFDGFTFDSLILTNFTAGAGELTFNGNLVTTSSLLIRGNEINNSDAVLVFTPSHGNNITYSFNWNAHDGFNFADNPATISITYKNTPPDATDIVYDLIKQGTTITIYRETFLAHYSDPDSFDVPTLLKLEHLPSSSVGTLFFNEQAINSSPFFKAFDNLDSISFHPVETYEGNITIDWTLSDGTDSDVAQIRFTYINTPPTVNLINISGFEDTPLNFDVSYFDNTFIDEDPGDNLQSISIKTLPGNGILELGGSTIPIGTSISRTEIDQLIFQPETDWNGNTSFQYNASDGTEPANKPATVHINIKAVNDAPRPDNLSWTIAEDYILSNVSVAGDYDIDDEQNVLTYLVADTDSATAGEHGTIQLDNLGNLSFTPEKDYFGTVYFNYTVCDDDDDMACDTGRVTIEIRPINDPPVAVNDTFSIYENDPPTSYNCLANDSDIDSPNLYLFSIDSSFTTPASSDYGKLAWGTDGILTFLINDLDSLYEDETIDVKFDYLVEDDSLATTPGIITLQIIGQNDTPLAKRDTFNFNEGFDSIYSGDNYATITENDEEIDGDDIFITLMNNDTVSPIGHKYGWFYWSTDGAWSFKENSAETDSLEVGKVVSFGYPYQISDRRMESTPDSVVFEITGINDAPVAMNDTLVITEDQISITIDTNNAKALLQNDYDIDEDSYWVAQINDDNTGSLISESEIGLLEWNSDGSYIFNVINTSVTNQLGVNDSLELVFTYTLIDENDSIDTAKLYIIITGTNDIPIARGETIIVNEDSIITVKSVNEGLLKNDEDIDHDILIVDVNGAGTKTTVGKYGSLTWKSDGAFTYAMEKEKVDTLSLGIIATDKFKYTVKDPSKDTASAYLTIKIIGANDAPFANSRDTSMTEDESPLVVSLPENGILSNDYDIDTEDTFNMVTVNYSNFKVTNGHYGFLKWYEKGTYSYTLNDSIDSLFFKEVVRDTFIYKIEDNHDSTAQSLFIIEIKGENDAPTAVIDTLDITEDTIAYTPDTTLLNNDFDIDGDTIILYSFNNQLTSPTLTKFALIEWSEDGSYTYTRNEHTDKSDGLDTLAYDDFIIDSIPYSIVDVHKNINPKEAFSYLKLGIQGINDDPVARRDSNEIAQFKVYIESVDSTSLLHNDYDVDRRDSITVYQVKGDTSPYTHGDYGELIWNKDGSYRYTWQSDNDSLSKDEKVVDIFPYTIIDRQDSIATNSLIIYLTGENDTPYARNDTIIVYEDDGSKELTGTDAILKNDKDIDGDPIHLLLNNQSEVSYTGTYGTLTLFENGDGRYDLNTGLDTLYKGEEVIDTFSYTIADNLGADSTATIFIKIIGENDAPDAEDDLGPIITEDTPSISSTDSLLINDTDIDKDWFYIESMNGSTEDSITSVYGSLKWDSLGNYTYYTNHGITNHLAMGETVKDTFTYILTDVFDGKDTAQFFITITGENDSIIAFNDFTKIDEDSYCAYNVVDNDEDPEGNFDYSSLKIVKGPLNGKASINSFNGVVYYFPDNNFNGKDSLQYQICDTGDPVYCDKAWFIIEVQPVNDPPVATNLILTTPVNTPVSFNAFDQVYDIDDGIDPGSLQWPSEQGVTRSGDMLTYSPPTDSIGVVEFIYSATDFAGERAYVIVNIIIQDEGFGAQNDTLYTNENTAGNVAILKNDTLNNFLTIFSSVEIKVFPLHGTATYRAKNMEINYQPKEGFNGTDSLIYLVGSRNDTWDYAMVYIRVQPLNSPIIVRDDVAKTVIDEAVEIPILANDEDEDNGIDYASVLVKKQPESGTISYNQATGVVTYTPNTGFTGNDSFVYQVCDLDTEDTSCDSATVFILVQSENENVNAQNDDYTTKEDTPKQLIDQLPTDNDSVKTGSIDLESLTILTDPHNGLYSIDNANIITYSPALNYFGPDWMTYQIWDTEGSSSDIAEINLWVEEVNDAPTAVNDTFMVTENTTKRLYILANDYDVDGTLNLLSLDTVAGKGPQKGEITIDQYTGTILYTPKTNSDTDEFTYQICDDKDSCSTATVFITINLGTTIYYNQITDEDTPNTFDIKPLLDDYNLFFNIDRVIEMDNPEIGTWEIISNNTQIVYTPDHDSIGSDFYRLILYAANGDSADLRVTVEIIPVNDAPVAVTDTITWSDTTSSITTNYDYILSNDYDVDGDSIFLTEAVIEQGNPDIIITFNKEDSTITITADTILWCHSWFTYEIADTALTAIGLVQLIPPLEGINAKNDFASVNENNSLNYENVVEIPILENDSVKDNQLCTIDTLYIKKAPLNGIAKITDSKEVMYRPNDHFFGEDSLQYIITDIWGQTDSAWVFITVNEINVPPVAQNDIVTSNLGEESIIDVLNNDYDPDPDGYIDTVLTMAIDYPLYGTLSEFNAILGFSYTPEVFSCDDDQFTYTIFDNKGDSDTATVNINFPDEAEIKAVTDTVWTYPGISKDFNVLTNDEGYFLPYIEYYQQPINGSVSQTGDSTFTYYPNTDFIGRDSMTYQLVSPCENQATGYVIFIIEELRVPEIITPNNDGKNDVLMIDGIENFPNSVLQIFNRQGHVVYQHKGYENNWDGHSNRGSLGGDKPLPSGTYFYTLIYNEGRNRQAGIIYINR